MLVMNDGQLARASTSIRVRSGVRGAQSVARRDAAREPAVGHALTRLRALFEDELFVRQSRGVALTPTADQIYAELRSALTCPNREFDLTDSV